MPKKIIVAADPFAVALKDAIVEHLKQKGFTVADLGATKEKEIPYYESAPLVCRAIQKGEAKQAVLFCGTGMGMSVIANRFKGVVAAVTESVFAAKMSRVINNANVLCLGSMIWGEWMAKEAVDAFLETKFIQGLENLGEFLQEAEKIVNGIRD
jgi:ribose 5-phosphate isomerase B